MILFLRIEIRKRKKKKISKNGTKKSNEKQKELGDVWSISNGALSPVNKGDTEITYCMITTNNTYDTLETHDGRISIVSSHWILNKN